MRRERGIMALNLKAGVRSGRVGGEKRRESKAGEKRPRTLSKTRSLSWLYPGT